MTIKFPFSHMFMEDRDESGEKSNTDLLRAHTSRYVCIVSFRISKHWHVNTNVSLFKHFRNSSLSKLAGSPLKRNFFYVWYLYPISNRNTPTLYEWKEWREATVMHKESERKGSGDKRWKDGAERGNVQREKKDNATQVSKFEQSIMK